MRPNERPVAKTATEALRNDATDIIELIDGGLQGYEGRSHGEGYSAQDDGHYRGVEDQRSKCWRCQERPATEDMDGACVECVAWLRDEGPDPMPYATSLDDLGVFALDADFDRDANGARRVDDGPCDCGFCRLMRRATIYGNTSPMLLELMRRATNTRPERLVEWLMPPPGPARARADLLREQLRESLVAAAELRTRTEQLHVNFGVEIPERGDLLDHTGFELPADQQPVDQFSPVRQILGLEVVEWNFAWDAISRRVVRVEDADFDVLPINLIVGELVEHFTTEPTYTSEITFMANVHS